MAPKVGVPYTVKVVGLTFRRDYPDNVLRLSGLVDDAKMADVRATTEWTEIAEQTRQLPVNLVRDPNNPHDANAIEVHVPALGLQGHLGFIERDLAARWAGYLDGDDYGMEATVAAVPIHPQHLDRPGVEITVSLHNFDCPRAQRETRALGLACNCNDDPPDWTI